MKARTAFAIVGWGLLGLAILGFFLRALFHVKTGTDSGYRTYNFQPMTYLGALSMLGMAALVGLIGLYYRVKRFLEQRASKQTAQEKRPASR
jgi:hypothetical protein